MNHINTYQKALQKEQTYLNPRFREEQIHEYASVVKYIAGRLEIRLPPSMSKDDLISAGTVGLNDALDRFDASKGAKFKTFAEYRIRGAMLDELRKMSWASRSAMTDIKKIQTAVDTLQVKLGREPEDIEIAEQLGADIDEYYKMAWKSQGSSLLSLDQVMPDGNAYLLSKQASDLPSGFDALKVKQLKQIVAKAISTLSKKEQLIISLYYYDELTLKEIGSVLDLTESRISQIHSKTMVKLRTALESYYESA